MLSRNGIYYDLSQSTYRVKINGLTFVFSSKVHASKFKKRLQENRDIINYSLSKRFNYKVDMSALADIVLYKKIETRGFLIVDSNGETLCPKTIICGGAKVMKESFAE